MHVGYFSSHLGTQGGPVIVDKRILEVISSIDHENQYTIYGVTKQSTEGLDLVNPNGNFTMRTLRPSGKWMAIPFGLTLELMKRPVDLLHATHFAPPVVPCKYAFTVTCWSQYAHSHFYPPLKRLRLVCLITRAIKKATAVFCYTEFLKEKLIEKFNIEPERIFIIQPGIGQEMKPVEDREYLSSFLRGLGIEGPFILFIGALTKRKNVEGLIRAYHILKKESKIEHKLVLLGERIFYSDSIFSAIEELNLKDDVIMIGRRPHTELPLFYSGADLFVFPTFSEGFGLPPLEAMACGTPVVASNVTSVPEVVGDAAVKVDPYKVEDIAEGMYRILSDSCLRYNLISKGIEHANTFTWHRAATQTLSAYKTICEGKW